MRDIAVISFAQTPAKRAVKELNEVEMLMPAIHGALGQVDMTIDDMLFVCFSMAVPACISIWFDVMLDDSVAKSTSMMRPVAACVLLEMFDRLL